MVEQKEEFSEEDYRESLEGDNYDSGASYEDFSGGQGGSIFGNSQEPNLIQWQLELDNILERIQHLLEGSVIGLDEKGNTTYIQPTDESLIILNDYGVKMIMNIISFYLNRNTILSNYKEERIQKILYDLGNKLADTIFINYEKMGLITMEKKSRYPLLVVNILNIIESSYLRALGGGERESLRTARMVNQTDSMGGHGFNGQPVKKNGFSLMKPSSWI